MRPRTATLLLVPLLLCAATAGATAQSSLGIGAAEATVPSSGLLGGATTWIALKQQEFYRVLTGLMRAMRDEGSGAWMLMGISFVYGVFHAAGPGHGKAVISSYMLANEVALRRGVLLSFASALLQAVTAIVVMTAVYFVLRGTTISMTDATRALEIASYALVTAFGLYLLWKKAGPRLARLAGRAPAFSLSAAGAHGHHHGADHAHHHHHHDHDGACATCGHSHAPDPALLSGREFDWRSAWTAVVAVGMRPCTGALVVLSFVFLNGLWVAGIASVFAMAFGTAITVSVLATLAVTAKNTALAFAGGGRSGNVIHAIIEIGGALLVLFFGLALLAASLSV